MQKPRPVLLFYIVSMRMRQIRGLYEQNWESWIIWKCTYCPFDNVDKTHFKENAEKSGIYTTVSVFVLFDT